ncbi:MAG: hypothetical protein WD063_06135 [Pirellulales bacterium]
MQVRLDLSGLKRLQRNAETFHGEHQVKLLEILSPQFMRSNTRFSSLEDMLSQCGIPEESFGDMPIPDKDDLTRRNTKFQSWQEMINAGAIEYTKKQLFK